METAIYTTELLKRRWLSKKTFEAVLSRPAGFEFTPGQRIRLLHQSLERDYSLINDTADSNLALCVRSVTGGRFSPLLSTAAIGKSFQFTGPHGYFVYRKSVRQPIFIATGTGVAPFSALARSGVKGYLLLHGVRQQEELYYAALLRQKSRQYIACLTEETPAGTEFFHGRVTDFLETQLKAGAYDFYLCGREDMIRDVIWLVDDKFSGSLVYTEIFY
jgi:ferredoxin-NADP reductase